MQGFTRKVLVWWLTCGCAMKSSDNIIERAQIVLKQLMETNGSLHKKNHSAIYGACLYIVCRQHDRIKTFEYVAKKTNVEKKYLQSIAIHSLDCSGCSLLYYVYYSLPISTVTETCMWMKMIKKKNSRNNWSTTYLIILRWYRPLQRKFETKWRES